MRGGSGHGPDAQARVMVHDAEELAVGFRDRAYELMDLNPIAAAHLVLAAASLAPTCRDERDVANHFAFLVADFANDLGRIHHRAKTANLQHGGGGR